MGKHKGLVKKGDEWEEWLGTTRLFVNTMRLEFRSAWRKEMIALVLIYLGEILIWREKERSMIRAIQIDNFRDFWVQGE